MSILEAANAYAAEIAQAKRYDIPLDVMLRRAYMAGALESQKYGVTEVVEDCLNFARTIGTPAERAAR